MIWGPTQDQERTLKYALWIFIGLVFGAGALLGWLLG